MTIGGSIFLIALGAILAFAVQTTVAGFDINIAGWILMGCGALGLLISAFIAMNARRDPYVDDRPVVRDRERRL